MKKIRFQLILLLVIIFQTNSFSQLAVTDPALAVLAAQTNASLATNNATQAQNLAKTGTLVQNAQKTLTSAKKQVKLLKQAKELFDKVNSVLNTVQEVDDIITLQSKIISSMKGNLKKLEKSHVFKRGEFQKIAKSFNIIFTSAIKSVELMDKLLSNDVFKMKDAERMKYLKEIKTDLQENLMDIKILTSEYQRIANKRIMKKMILKTEELNQYN